MVAQTTVVSNLSNPTRNEHRQNEILTPDQPVKLSFFFGGGGGGGAFQLEPN